MRETFWEDSLLGEHIISQFSFRLMCTQYLPFCNVSYRLRLFLYLVGIHDPVSFEDSKSFLSSFQIKAVFPVGYPENSKECQYFLSHIVGNNIINQAC